MKKKLGLGKKRLAMLCRCSVAIDNLRDVEGSIWPEVSGGNAESLSNLIFSRSTVVLNVAILRLDVVRVEIGNGGNIGVGNLAVIALVVVIGKNLPVEVTLHIPGVIEIIFIKVVILEARLLIGTFKVIFPGNLRGLGSIQVDPNEAIAVKVHVDRRKLVAQECLNLALVIFGNNELVTGGIIADPITGVGDAGLVCGEEPLAREDRPALEIIHGLGSIPGGGKSANGGLVLLCILNWGSRSSTEEIPEEGHFECA